MALDILRTVNEFGSRLRPLPSRIYNLTGSSGALLLALMEEPFVMVERTEEEAERLWRDVLFYRKLLGSDAPDVLYLPPANGPERAGRRAGAVQGLSRGESTSLITSGEAVEEEVWPPGELTERVFRLKKGEEDEREKVERGLIGLGYERAPLVAESGQYSLRGFILDVFPSTSSAPLRVEFFGDEIESIREFDVETQRSVEEKAGVEVLPAREPEAGVKPAVLWGEKRIFYAEKAGGGAPPEAVVLSRFPIAGEGEDAGLFPMSGNGVLPGERKDIYGLPGALEMLSAENRVVVVASSGGQAERLREVFAERNVVCPFIELENLARYAGRLSMTSGGLSSGLFLPGLMVLTEREIFGERPGYRPIKKSKASGLLTNIDDLRVGDYVVHADRGVGEFEGLVHQSVDGCEYDMLALRYEGGDRLYIPLYGIDRIRKFHVEDGVRPRLSSLGSRKWQRTKEKIKKSIKEMARKLLGIYAEREVSGGVSFSRDTEAHREFDGFFPYEETEDQLRAVEEIKRDMESVRPMERLLSGDVGYGKTEVAMRAAFKAVFDGKQVAVLVPTTLLCEQHERIFKKRFSAFPVSIESVSRFKSRTERLETLDKLKKGRVDIVVATHALLKPGVAFGDLGLLVIDEEHRFGVRQKERIKELKKGVDVLSLSATPIPRTLQMSLGGIRSMSVIETPPEERLAVKSEVSVYDEGLIRKAIEKEIARGGQVFYVHNRVKDIGRVERRLKEIVPLARVAVAHGQMPEGELEKIMLSFLDGGVDVLLSTAIIGSGIDIPSANTIIINMAHRMGLADLYQLKGRVGRSNVRAYAYYLVPPGAAVTEEAARRLQAVQELSYMGAGFRLAMKDLEIRGAGNLLGAEQSGYINAVGFDLYMEMLGQAVAELKGHKAVEKPKPAINIRINAFIPEGYVEDMALRLSVYRSISSARNVEDLGEIESEMSDRFGRPPEEFIRLLKIKEISLLAGELSIAGVSSADGTARFELYPDSPLTAEGVVRALGGGVRFFGSGFGIALSGGVCGGVKSALESLRREFAAASFIDSP
jgi:transcription-repair coupling factor (superfamily II helicase)